MSSIVLPTGTRGWNRMPGLRRRRDLLFGFRAAGLELVDLATGQPISFSRASPGGLVPVLGGSGASRWTVLSGPHAHNVPRFVMLDRDGDGVRETPALRLEPQRTNLIAYSSALNQWTKVGTPTVTDDAIAFGALSLALVRDPTAGALNYVQLPVTLTGDGQKCVSVYLAQSPNPSPTGTDIVLRDNTAQADRLRARVTWSAGAPAITMIAGTAITAPQHVGQGIYRLQFRSTAVTAANSHTVQIEPARQAETGDVYAGGVQVENAVVPSSLIITTGASASRAVELFSAPWPHAPQAMTVYARFVEAGTIAITSGFPRIVQIGAFTGARLVMYCNNAGRYGFDHFTAAGVQRSVVLATGPSIGQTVELLGTLYPDGSVQLTQSIDGGSATATARSAASALSSAWSAAMLTIGSAPGGGNAGQTDLLDLLILRGAGWTMDAARRAAGVA